ncbi:acyltransferase [Actinosynnema sp. NPDC023658]|uniref:acyltransferase family protein n=1 Tax=Actinosynnema sp. NPDC023658 TaxID=3155465 RepID=UPI0033FC1F48
MSIWGRWRSGPIAPNGRKKAADGFGTVRLVAAFFVIIDHAAPLTKSGGSILPTRFGVDLGAVTVSAFMAMSGFLVIRSWERDPHLWRFAVKRALRIMPGLLVVLCLSAFVLGPVLTTLSTGAYFDHPLTWSYITDNIRVFPQQYVLPGVFNDNPYPNAVNGSLWSLPVEVLGYALIAVFGLVGAVKRRWMVLVAAFALTVVFQRLLTKQLVLPKVLLMVPTVPLVQYLAVYCVGMLAYLYRDKIRYSWFGVVVCVAVEYVMHASAMTEVTRLVTVPYVVLAIGTLLPQKLWLPSAVTMSSYGVYLYGFPTEQFVVHLGVESKWLVALFSVPIAFALGMMSWHFVESPGMKLRKVLLRRRPAKPPEPPAAVDEPVAAGAHQPS